MSRCFRVLAVAALCVVASTALADDPKQPDAKLEGTWALASLEVNGQKVSEETLTNATITIKGNKYTFKIQDQSEDGTLKVDASKKPATIDLDILSGESKGKKQLGIYEVDDKSFKICLTEPGNETRPKEIRANEGSGQLLFVFKKK
jgi:uncharacterized protein (TIGR03067 family)